MRYTPYSPRECDLTITWCVWCSAAGCICAHVHILADHVTLSISEPEKLVSCLAASLAMAPKRLRLE